MDSFLDTYSCKVNYIMSIAARTACYLLRRYSFVDELFFHIPPSYHLATTKTRNCSFAILLKFRSLKNNMTVKVKYKCTKWFPGKSIADGIVKGKWFTFLCSQTTSMSFNIATPVQKSALPSLLRSFLTKFSWFYSSCKSKNKLIW